MTFFTTRPPDLKVSPRPDTTLTPSMWSRAAPAFSRRGPDRLAESAPPIVPPLPPRVSWASRREQSIGSKASCWLFCASSRSMSAIGVPALADSTSSSGS